MIEGSPPPEIERPLWTTADVAVYAKVSPYTVRRASNEGELRSIRLPGERGQFRYQPEWVKQWLGLPVWLTMLGLAYSVHHGLVDGLTDALF